MIAVFLDLEANCCPQDVVQAVHWTEGSPTRQVNPYPVEIFMMSVLVYSTTSKQILGSQTWFNSSIMLRPEIRGNLDSMLYNKKLLTLIRRGMAPKTWEAVPASCYMKKALGDYLLKVWSEAKLSGDGYFVGKNIAAYDLPMLQLAAFSQGGYEQPYPHVHNHRTIDIGTLCMQTLDVDAGVPDTNQCLYLLDQWYRAQNKTPVHGVFDRGFADKDVHNMLALWKLITEGSPE